MALDLGQYDITVNAICPGATETEMLRDVFRSVPGLEEQLRARPPVGRLAQPRRVEVAGQFVIARALLDPALLRVTVGDRSDDPEHPADAAGAITFGLAALVPQVLQEILDQLLHAISDQRSRPVIRL